MKLAPAPLLVVLVALLLLAGPSSDASASTPGSDSVIVAVEYQGAGIDFSARGRFFESLLGLSFSAGIAELADDSWLSIGGRLQIAMDPPFPSAFALLIEPLATFEWLVMNGKEVDATLLAQVGPTFAFYESTQLANDWWWAGAAAGGGGRLYVGAVALHAIVGIRYALALRDTSTWYYDAWVALGLGVSW